MCYTAFALRALRMNTREQNVLTQDCGPYTDVNEVGKLASLYEVGKLQGCSCTESQQAVCQARTIGA
jgi:hypothetical protein